MSDNPARAEIDSKTGGGWGAPLKAEFGPVDVRRRAGLLSSIVARDQGLPEAPSLVRRPRVAIASLLDGVSPRSAATPVTGLRPRHVQAHPEPAPSSAPAGRPQALRPAPPQLRTVTHVDLRSVAKVSAVFYAVVLIVMVVASVLLWVVADAAGALHSIDHSVQSLFGVKRYTLHPTTIALYSCAAGAVVAVTGTLVNLLAATVYNLISDVVGGIRVKVADR